MFDNFYGLTGRPFQLTPDPAFYFESQTHRKALSYLGYGLAQGEGFVVITGEVGAGKSTLVAHLMQTIDPSRLTAAQVVTSKLDGEEIIHVVAQAFGLMIEGHDKASALGAIESFLHDEARAGRRCLLIVDESQNLSVEALEELRMLSNFQLGSHPLLQTLLLGQPEFRDTLAKHSGLEQLRQRVIATHHLAAMELQEVQHYIEHRLKCVGWDGNPSFDQRVFVEIHEATGGIPRRINQIVNRLLLLGSVDERARIDGPMVEKVLTDLCDDGAFGLAGAVDATPAEDTASPAVAETRDEPEGSESRVGITVEDISELDEAPVREDAETNEGAQSDDAADVNWGISELVEDPFESEMDASEEADAAPAAFSPPFAAPGDGPEPTGEPGADETAEAAEPTGQFEMPVEASPAPVPDAEPADAPSAAARVEAVAGLAADEVQAMLAERDEQIAELQQAVVELSDAHDDNIGRDKDADAQINDLSERISALEGRIIEQDRTIRHTLTMLIEWIESGEGDRDAA